MIDIEDLIAEKGKAPKIWQSPNPMDLMSGAHSWGKAPVEDSEELQRILKLDRRPVPTGARLIALQKYVTKKYRREVKACNCRALGRDCITELRPVQAWALHEIATTGGLLAPIGVGHGKTAIDILTPLAMQACRHAVLLVPPNLVNQLKSEYELLKQHFRVPKLLIRDTLHGTLDPNAPVLNVYPYSLLSRPESSGYLEHALPDLIIADECHKLKNQDTSTAGRVLRYFHNHPQTRFCGWSGSITDSSIREFAHLSNLALRSQSPVPRSKTEVDDWARALDPGEFQAPPGALLKFCEPDEDYYAAIHRRFIETQGVVHTTAPAIESELVITERKAPPIPKKILAYIEQATGGERPDGEEFDSPLAMHRCIVEMVCGFYYRWIFPRGESPKTIDAWFAARKAWHKELRGKLMYPEIDLDSPKLCFNAAQRYHTGYKGKKPVWRSEHWPEWNRLKDTVQPETEAVRIDDYLVQDAAAWARENRGIVWYERSEMGKWIEEISGLPRHGGGPKAGEIIAAEKGKTSIICSIKSHGTGRDGLQRLFNTQLITTPPSSNQTTEQLLGRLHRVGQKSKTVYAEIYLHSKYFRDSFDTALRRAQYVNNMLGSTQKIQLGYSED